jgi:hypothetical protein
MIFTIEKFEQAVIALNFSNINVAFYFYEEFCMCKDILLETSNGNILCDVRLKWLHVYRKFYPVKEIPNMFKLTS